jgi:hypothetical protein
MTGRRDTPIRSRLRRFTLGSGPLKRASDRVEVAGRIVVVLSLLVAPALAVAATTVATGHLEAVAAEAAAERTLVHAVLREDAWEQLDRTGSASGAPELETVPVPAVWPVPGAAERAGIVLVDPHTPAGTTVPVWVDRAGNITSAPPDRSSINSTAMTSGALVLIGVPLVTLSLHAVLCAALDAHREHRWAQGWAAVGPEWATRLL